MHIAKFGIMDLEAVQELSFISGPALRVWG